MLKGRKEEYYREMGEREREGEESEVGEERC